MLYNPPTGAATANDGYVGKNVSAGVQGSKVPPKGVEYPQRELVNALAAASLPPTNNDLTQLAQAMSIGLWLGAMGGSANALADTLPTLSTTSDGVSQYAIPSLQPGMTFHGIVAATNTGPATLTLVGFGTAPGAKPVVKKDGVSPMQAGDLPAGAIVTFKWDGTSYRVTGLVQSDVLALILSNQQTNLISGGRFFIFSAGSGTWTAPGTGTYPLRLRLWGAGGGGGGAQSTSAISGGSGGGGGEYAEGTYMVTGGQSYAYAVGQGGAAGSGTAPSNGGPGGTTSFGGLVTAGGGGGGFVGQNGLQTTSSGIGGSGSSAPFRLAGTGGGLSFSVAPNSVLGGIGGYPFGAGSPGPNNNTPGTPGLFPGVGGNGGAVGSTSGNNAGGLGYNGLIIGMY